MKLIDRIQQLDPQGGRYRLGAIRAEADIRPDDWFLTCHFVDDMTMPGTLMYECCSHTLRVFLLRMGWVTDRPGVRYDTVPGIKSVLQCRGPVTPRTRQVVYEVEIKEIGYGPEPYALADAHMYADDRYIVRFTDMAIRMSGLNRETLINDWQSRRRFLPRRQEKPSTPVFFDRGRILAFAIGKPSEAFGDRYEAFDTDRFLARLPAPPYSFIDRVIKAEPEPWKLKPGGWVEAEFDVRPDDWYFIANQSDHMPYCVLLEIALQACGWLAAYAGSALRSANDLRFRNLDGQAILHREVSAAKQTLRSRCRMTKVSTVGDIIIESFEFQVLDQDHFIYDGKTVFGFFTSDALADQRGVQVNEHQIVVDGSETRDAADGIHLPDRGPLTPADADGPLSPCGLAMPAKALRMIDRIEIRQPLGGPHGLGYLRATKKIDPAEWFFDAHFYQDPVCPGSLGIESFLQLLKFEAIRRWGHLTDDHRFEHTLSGPHTWKYRGQISKQNQIVEVEAFIKYIKNEPEPELRADGILTVDGLPIYHMKDYGIRLVPL
jgi:3-hydroxymyristoyl/3-hydroxydecanoyl-(acyl carrier protein) dehydratase